MESLQITLGYCGAFSIAEQHTCELRGHRKQAKSLSAPFILFLSLNFLYFQPNTTIPSSTTSSTKYKFEGPSSCLCHYRFAKNSFFFGASRHPLAHGEPGTALISYAFRRED